MSRRLVRWCIVAALGVLVTMAIVAGVGSRTSTLRKLVIDTLAERLDSEVELGSLSVDTIPSVHITGTALVIRHKNRRDVPPLVSVDSFTLDGGLFGLLSRPRRFRVVSVSGLRLNIPPGGINGDSDTTAPDSTPAPDHSADRNTKAAMTTGLVRSSSTGS